MRVETRRAARAGTTTWWTNAVLAKTVSPDEALSHVTGDVLITDLARTSRATGGSDESPDGPRSTRTDWLQTWAGLRGSGCSGLSLVLPVPGDPLGMPGPAEVTKAAILSGAALVCGPQEVTLVPEDSGFWRQYATEHGPQDRGLGTLSEARRIMREAMVDITQSVTELNPDPEALVQIQRARATPAPTPPAGTDPRAADLAMSAALVWQLVLIAKDAADRRDVSLPELGPLSAAARRALSVSFSHPISNQSSQRAPSGSEPRNRSGGGPEARPSAGAE